MLVSHDTPRALLEAFHLQRVTELPSSTNTLSWQYYLPGYNHLLYSLTLLLCKRYKNHLPDFIQSSSISISSGVNPLKWKIRCACCIRSFRSNGWWHVKRIVVFLVGNNWSLYKIVLKELNLRICIRHVFNEDSELTYLSIALLVVNNLQTELFLSSDHRIKHLLCPFDHLLECRKLCIWSLWVETVKNLTNSTKLSVITLLQVFVCLNIHSLCVLPLSHSSCLAILILKYNLEEIETLRRLITVYLFKSDILVNAHWHIATVTKFFVARCGCLCTKHNLYYFNIRNANISILFSA
nr:MAG TPA: hypothetical protein [Caudoviricetes sp.]